MNEFEDQLRDRLTGAVPEPPVAPDRAARAHTLARQGRRRRQAGVAAGGAFAVALAIGVPVMLSSGDGRGDRPLDSPSLGADRLMCPEPAQRTEDPVPVTGPDRIADGAVVVRLCAPYGGDWALTSAPPLDALTDGADRVAEALNGLDAVDEDPERVCTTDAGPTWDLVFGYTDGHAQVARGNFAGCGGWRVGGVERGTRSDMAEPLDLFQELLWTQRLTSPVPTYEGTAPGCDRADRGAMSPQQPLSAEAAALCWSFDSATEQQRQRAVLTTEQALELLDDLNTNAAPTGEPSEEECRDPEQPRLELALANAWGDVLRLDGWCGVFDLGEVPGHETDARYWRPSRASQAILDEVIEANPATIAQPDASTPAAEVLTTWADLRNAGLTDRAAALWEGASQPTPVGRIELKVEGVRRIPTPVQMSMPLVMREVTALYWVVAEDGSWDQVHEMVFTLTRRSGVQPWTIVSVIDRGTVEVGR